MNAELKTLQPYGSRKGSRQDVYPKNAFLMELDMTGENVLFYQIYANAEGKTVIANDSAYYIVSGIYYGTDQNAWVMFTDLLGNALDTLQFGSTLNDFSTNCIYDPDWNTFVLCGTYRPPGTSNQLPAVEMIPGLINSRYCPFWYSRAIRMPYTAGSTGTNHFLQDIFDWDHTNLTMAHETDNLLLYIKYIHANKLIIDGLYYNKGTGGCGYFGDAGGLLSEYDHT
jgi:hypothetical protein